MNDGSRGEGRGLCILKGLRAYEFYIPFFRRLGLWRREGGAGIQVQSVIVMAFGEPAKLGVNLHRYFQSCVCGCVVLLSD
jgi:hypothetical protein